MSEQLARLTAKGVQLDSIAGGISELKGSEVASALAGLSEPLTKYAYLAYIYSQEQIESDFRAKADMFYVHRWMSDIFMQRLVPIQRRKADRLALIHIQTCQDGKVCLNCNGHKDYLTASGQRKSCSYCEATGHHMPLVTYLCRISNIQPSNWAKQYHEHYKLSLEIVTEIKQKIATHVRNRLKR